MHILLVFTYKSQDFAQSQENFARSHDPETVTFKNSGSTLFYPVFANLCLYKANSTQTLMFSPQV